jgi:hypothetical protein
MDQTKPLKPLSEGPTTTIRFTRDELCFLIDKVSFWQDQQRGTALKLASGIQEFESAEAIAAALAHVETLPNYGGSGVGAA